MTGAAKGATVAMHGVGISDEAATLTRTVAATGSPVTFARTGDAADGAAATTHASECTDDAAPITRTGCIDAAVGTAAATRLIAACRSAHAGGAESCAGDRPVGQRHQQQP